MRKIRKYFEMNANKDTTYGNLWDAANAMLRGKFIVENVYIKKKKKMSTFKRKKVFELIT